MCIRDRCKSASLTVAIITIWHLLLLRYPDGNKNRSIGRTRCAQLGSSCVPPCAFSKCSVSPGFQWFAFSLRFSISTSCTVRLPSLSPTSSHTRGRSQTSGARSFR